MRTIESQTITDECLSIDDTIFIQCKLINCVLEYSGSPVVFELTQMKNCRYVFFGRAKSTVHFLQGVGLMNFVPSEWGDFSDAVN